MAQSKRSKHQEVNAFITSLVTPEHQNVPLLFAIAEFLQVNNVQILIVKSLICGDFTPKQRLLLILPADSTTKERVLKPYWNEQCPAISSQLWLPTKTVLQDLESNSSSGYYNQAVVNSWFSISQYQIHKENSQKTFLPSSISLVADSTVSDVIHITRCKKIRVFPTTLQKNILAQWFGISRVAYNKSIEFLNIEETVANFLKNKKEIYHSLPEWSSFCPSHVRQLAIKDAHEAVKYQKAKAKKSGKPFSMKFRSRKDSQIIKFSVSDYQNGLYKTKLGFLKLSEQLPENICDASLTLVNGQYYLNVPYKTTLQTADNQGEMVALDPGVRSFQTYYSPSSCGEIGAKCIGRIYRLCQHLDNLMSRKLWKPAAKVRIKIKNLVTELHFQTANFLTQNYSTILIPAFETSQMISKKRSRCGRVPNWAGHPTRRPCNRPKKASRKIRTKTARAMMTCSHYQFRQRLINKAVENGCQVVVVTEEYTSKTASWTGEIINIGSRSSITSGGVTLDRDINGARGIFLKALVDSPDLRKKVASVSFS